MNRVGLVLGKFMPLHRGHIELIRFASEKVDKLIVLICAHAGEPISGPIREQWVKQTFQDKKIEIHLMAYDSSILPDTSVSSRDVSRLWADYLRTSFPEIQMIFSSEQYGDYLAEHLHIEHIQFDAARNITPVSGSQIRDNPFKFWDCMPPVVQSYFVKKICILGTESTGKSILTESLARHFNTVFVPEVAREIVSKTEDVTTKDLIQIAEQHARLILKKVAVANKLLFVDTDLNITKSYSKFLFNQPLITADWIDQANAADLYFYLESDCPYIQDGTRLSEERREHLNQFHKLHLSQANIPVHIINGNWDNRFNTAIDLINETYFND
jgi:HTH-type transcriptional regulator, transcriptional repressor of NAD biosynthesis genes